MSKIDLDPITSGYNLSKINANFQKVEDELNNKVLYRDSPTGEPNSMSSNLDMNNRSILNASKISSNVLELGGVQVVPTNLAIDPYNGTREALRRSYAEAGYNLVDGSFEAGGTLVNANDVLLQKSTGKAFSGPAGAVDADTNPASGGFTDRSTSPISVKRSIIADAIGMALSEWASLHPVTPEEFMTIADRVSQQSSPGSVDVHYAIQKALDQKSRPVHLGPYLYSVSKPVVVYPGSTLIGCGEDRTIIEKTTNTTSGLPLKTFGGGQTIVMDVDAVVILDPPRDGQGGGNTYSLFNKIEGFEAKKKEGIGLDYTGYSFFFPLVALSSFDRLRGWNTEYGVYSKNAWMISWNRVYSRAIKPWVIEGGTSNHFVDAWLIGAATGDVSTSYGYDFRNLLYSTMLNCGADALGSDGRPYLGLYNFAFSDITLINCACEASHISTLLRAQQSNINVDNFRTLNVSNRYKTGSYQSWIIGTGSSVVKFKNGITSGLFDKNDPTHGSQVPKQATMDSGSILEYVDVVDSGIDVATDFAVVNGTNSGIHYRSKGYIKDIGSITPATKTGATAPVWDTSFGIKTSGLIETSNGINLNDTTNSSSSKSINFVNFEGRYGYLRGDFGDAGGGNATGLTVGVYTPGVGVGESVVFTSDKRLTPASDNTQSLGNTTKRWSVVYAGTGAINTSDEREKTQPLPIDDLVLDAWGDVQLITFQWLESIRLKGEGARTHFGVIAQQVRDAFAARGLNGCDYGLLCYDEWDDIYKLEQEEFVDESGKLSWRATGNLVLDVPAGNRWGIRPDQCLFLEAAYQRRRCARIEERLAAIEKNII